MRLSKGMTIVVATDDFKKMGEIKELLDPYGLNLVTAMEMNLTLPAETGVTFEENALVKAQYCAAQTNLPALSDNSGLCVRALGGQPGVFTARWAGQQQDYQHAIKKLYEELNSLGERPDRRAHFECCIALSFPNGKSFTFVGKVEGELVWPPRGNNNLGLDSIFQPIGHHKTFAEMSLKEKSAISHRQQAFKKLVNACVEEYVVTI